MDLGTDAVRQTLAALRRKQLELRLSLEKVDAAIRALTQVDEMVDPLGPATPRVFGEVDPEYEGLSIPEAAERILRETGAPTHVYEIITRLQGRGFRADQAREALRLSVVGALARKARARDTFISKGPGTYGLRDWEASSGSDDQDAVAAERRSEEEENAVNGSSAEGGEPPSADEVHW